ncbi:MAG TPA: hypothetical protein VNG12_15355 [Acidimicrobiales bacterium]|nr:hypothetical protein [Acidimicrobiales bacterium]
MVRREFAVGVVLGTVAGAGRLVVAPGKLELKTGSITGRLSHVDGVEHAGSRVTAYTARLLPPWMNCSVVVSDWERSALATFPLWMRRRLLSVLREDGFEVTLRATLIERGYEAMTF